MTDLNTTDLPTLRKVADLMHRLEKEEDPFPQRWPSRAAEFFDAVVAGLEVE